MNSKHVEDLIDLALAEDLSAGDPTTESLIAADSTGAAEIVSRQTGVLAGIDTALAVFSRIDPSLEVRALEEDGATLAPGDSLARVEGAVASILKAERTALNFLYRLCGVATLASVYSSAVHGTGARIIDTRKTTPGMRALEKAAVRAGGAFNHRQNLGDGVLIKDNHIAALAAQGTGLRQVVELARAGAAHTLRVEVEVESIEQAKEALAGGAEILLLDNMDVPTMTEAVRLAQGRAITEASGGITLATVRDVAETGVDLISVGELTHSAPGFNVSLEFEDG